MVALVPRVDLFTTSKGLQALVLEEFPMPFRNVEDQCTVDKTTQPHSYGFLGLPVLTLLTWLDGVSDRLAPDCAYEVRSSTGKYVRLFIDGKCYNGQREVDEYFNNQFR